MIDQFDARLDSAGREPIEDARVRDALNALVDDRALAARTRPPRRLLPECTPRCLSGRPGSVVLACLPAQLDRPWLCGQLHPAGRHRCSHVTPSLYRSLRSSPEGPRRGIDPL